jgi:hypothetical protein
MPIQIGKPLAWGCRPEYTTAQVVNLPPDTIKVRRRIRNNRAAVAFVRTETTVEKWVLAPDGDRLKLEILQAVNVIPCTP